MREKLSGSVSWWEPSWSYVPRRWHEMRQVLSLQAWLRIVGISAVVTLALAVYLHIEVPAVQIDWPMKFCQAVSVAFCAMLVHEILHLTIPPTLTVRPRGVTYQHGQAVRHYALCSIGAIHLFLQNQGRASIWISTSRLCQRYGVARRADLAKLEKILGDKLVVHDHRGEPIVEDADDRPYNR